MIVEYVADTDTTQAKIDGEIIAEMDGKVSEWRGGVPNPDTEWFHEFQTGLLELNSTDERKVILQLIAGEIERIGFEQ